MKKKDYLEELDKNETIMEIYHKFYMNVVTAIIHNIKGLQNVSDAEYRQYVKKTTKDIYNKTNQEVLKVNKSLKQNVGKSMKKSANTKLQSMEDMYKYKDIPLIMTKTELDIVSDAIAKSFKEAKKMNAELPQNAKKQYINSVNKYTEELVKGNITFDEAVKRATKEVREKGINLSYKRQINGKVQTVHVEPDVAVKRNIIDNMKEAGDSINQEVQEKLGTDGWMTNVSGNARPSHQVWQGRIFADGSVGKRVNGVYYEPFDRYKDELNDYNCQHSASPVFLGIAEPEYSESELRKINNRTVKYKGKKISAYDGSQIQRRLENQIRKTKRNIEALEKEGLDAKEEKNRLQHEYKKYREASREMEMEQKYRNLRVF